ncbi:hypothetical protein VTN77DRAFT_7291 [Rasamsonia byssochlamydoides]|uniref:uncharacterized protein n=1 Tax=Rasamsonia byssochlamydoides TaxID=89139 RepID=UPI003744ADD7
MKIFHTPTVQKQILKATQDMDNIDPATGVLMFAIYYATVMTMQPADCLADLKEDRVELLSRSAQDVTATDPDVWMLTGLALRIAVRLGVHRDGTALDILPFEIEMRRRLWWQICILDMRTAEDHGKDPLILECSFNTRLPANVNDSNLDPNMSDLPANYAGRTEMLFCLVRFEISYFARRVVSSEKSSRDNGYELMTAAQKSDAIDQLSHKLEEQYLAYCDRHTPSDSLTKQSD